MQLGQRERDEVKLIEESVRLGPIQSCSEEGFWVGRPTASESAWDMSWLAKSPFNPQQQS